MTAPMPVVQCEACRHFQRSHVSREFGKCTRLSVHGSKLVLGADRVRADEARCGVVGKWFQEAWR
jgi:hypothetical protein